MPKKSKAEKAVQISTIVAIIVTVVGIALIGIAQYRSLDVLQLPGIVLFAIGFLTYLAHFPVLRHLRTIKYRRELALIAVLNGECVLPPDEQTKDQKNEKRAAAQKQRSLNRRLDELYRELQSQPKDGERVGKNKRIRPKKRKAEKHICENCGSEMRKNMRNEWVCPYCDAALEIDLDKLRDQMNAEQNATNADDAVTATVTEGDAVTIAVPLPFEQARDTKKEKSKKKRRNTDPKSDETLDASDDVFAQLESLLTPSSNEGNSLSPAGTESDNPTTAEIFSDSDRTIHGESTTAAFSDLKEDPDALLAQLAQSADGEEHGVHAEDPDALLAQLAQSLNSEEHGVHTKDPDALLAQLAQSADGEEHGVHTEDPDALLAQLAQSLEGEDSTE